MKVEIYYCGVWNYLPAASRLEEELKGKYSGIEVELNKGSGGIFKVVNDGALIFDKAESARFPDENEIIKLIEDL